MVLVVFESVSQITHIIVQFIQILLVLDIIFPRLLLDNLCTLRGVKILAKIMLARYFFL